MKMDTNLFIFRIIIIIINGATKSFDGFVNND